MTERPSAEGAPDPARPAPVSTPPAGPTRRARLPAPPPSAPTPPPIQWRTPLQAIVLRPVLTAIIFLICVGGSVAFTLRQDVAYTAESRIVVGRVDVQSNAVPGYSNANANLAQTYSRFVGTSLHLQRVADALEVPIEQVVSIGRISASPIPQGPIIRVMATAATAEAALVLADAGTTGLQDLVKATNDASGTSATLLAEYTTAALALSQAEVSLASAQRTLDLVQGTTGVDQATVDSAQQAVVVARAAVLNQQAVVNGAETNYLESLSGRADGELLRVLSAARATGHDRMRNAQLGLGAGVLLGAFVSIGFVWLLANRLALKAFRSQSALPQPSAGTQPNGPRPAPRAPAGDTVRLTRDPGRATQDVPQPRPS